MLRQICEVVRERGRISLRELAMHFRSDPEALEPMLDLLVARGRLRRLDDRDGKPCRKCLSCAAEGRSARVVFVSCDDVA